MRELFEKPMKRSQVAYGEFLRSEFWREQRWKCFERDGFRCVGCGARGGLQAHHWRYRGSWWDTEVGDLETLCDGCHENRHT